MGKRRQHHAEGKARVALEAAQGLKTVHAIAQEHQVHPVQVSQWKKELIERLPEVFGRKAGAEAEDLARQKERLERKVGELTMDVEFLKKVRTTGHPAGRAAMIEPGHPHMSIRRQSELLGADRGRVYRTRQGSGEECASNHFVRPE